MHTLGDMYGQFMLRLCLWCLGSIAAGVAFCVLASIAKRYAKLVRRVGLFAAILLSTFIFGMIREGVTTQEDKDDYRNAMEPLMEERAAIARILLPSDGDLPRADSSLAEMNADPPRSAPETTWLSFSHWNHGIYMGGERVDFAPGWVFPYGSNHLSSVEVMAWGEILSNSRSLTPIASLGRRVSLLPSVSSFQYGLTPSNTYTFAWNGARDGRISGEPFDGIIELFRHGDISVTTNGVTEVYPRILPFSHDGFGQDDEWVAANFTNATEILAVGYPQWVDAQVGEGLTNGLYKLTVSVTEDPLETTLISAGDYSIAVTNAGAYVFLMEKGVGYDFGVLPGNTNITISAIDDVPMTRSAPRLRSGAAVWGNSGHWVGGYGEFGTGYNPGDENATYWWLPSIIGAPDLPSTGPDGDSVEFSAVLFDCNNGDDISFTWTVSDGLTAVSPYAQTTEVEAESSSDWVSAYVAVTAWIGSLPGVTSWLHLNVSTNLAPYAGVSIALPSAMFANNDDDNGDGVVDFEGNIHFSQSDDDDVVCGCLSFHSDVPTNGTIQLTVTGFTGDVYTNNNRNALIYGTVDIPVDGVTSLSVPLYINPYFKSSYNGGLVTAEWVPEEGDGSTRVKAFTVVEPVLETICSETKTASPQGASHVYTYNPCAVAVGDDAYFKIDVLPNEFLDSEIVWSSSNGGVEFIGGDTGREVHVRGTSVCDTTLEISIGGRTHKKPGFPLKVVEAKTYKITAWIVSGQNGLMPIQTSQVQDMISPLNDVYRQVGVSFYLDSITVTNIPDAFNLLCDSTTNDVWNFQRLVNIGSSADGVRCYFVNSMIRNNGRPGPAGSSLGKGVVIPSASGPLVLAHEIGHVFGLSDIYSSNEEKFPTIPSDQVKQIYRERISHFNSSSDWNGGCQGYDEGGARYYPYNTLLSDVLRRMMMYGVERDDLTGCDITAGSVHGIWYTLQQSEYIWHAFGAPVGFFDTELEITPMQTE